METENPVEILLSPEGCDAEDPDEDGEDVCVDHSLDLLAVARRDVADGPARLLPHALLDRVPAQQRQQARHHRAV